MAPRLHRITSNFNKRRAVATAGPRGAPSRPRAMRTPRGPPLKNRLRSRADFQWASVGICRHCRHRRHVLPAGFLRRTKRGLVCAGGTVKANPEGQNKNPRVSPGFGFPGLNPRVRVAGFPPPLASGGESYQQQRALQIPNSCQVVCFVIMHAHYACLV